MSSLADVDPLQAQSSSFHPFRQPEMTRDIEIYSSLGRSFLDISESGGLKVGRSFASWCRGNNQDDTTSDRTRAISETLADHLRVPPSSNEKGLESILSMIPLAPSLIQVTGFTRKTGNPWNPGKYVAGMVKRGADDSEEAKSTWDSLGKAYLRPCDPSNTDRDRWASLIEEELDKLRENWSGIRGDQVLGSLPTSGKSLQSIDFPPPSFPARSFVQDLHAIDSLSVKLTRRQWISMLDSFLRLALVSDLLWIAALNTGLANLIHQVSETPEEIPTAEDLGRALLPQFFPLLIGADASEALRDSIRSYAKARIFVREFLNALRAKHSSKIIEIEEAGGLNTAEGVIKTLKTAALENGGLVKEADVQTFKSLGANPDFMRMAKSQNWTAQWFFCCKMALGQRGTFKEEDRHFDQGYWCKRKGASKNSPVKFDIGPVGLLTMTHLANVENEGIVTVSALQRHLARYGVGVSENDLASGRIGQDLRRLGLVHDSPDAEGGMILKSPFQTS
ncbi:Rrf2 family transcriptional regulator [Verrucomicrobiales bacterium]|nr:Rrf2 family transcriptional regulator [Verrucomicrobiales bacterium]